METAATGLVGAVEQRKDDDAASRLTYEIFSLLETKFLFGGARHDVARPAGLCFPLPATVAAGTGTPRAPSGKVCVLSIDGGARAADGLLAAAALVRLEAALRRRSGSSAARLPDFFDVAAGSGAGGVLAAMLFARDPRGRPMYTAEDALAFLLRRVRRGTWSARAGVLAVRRGRGPAFGKAFGDLTLRDTVRPVLVPCYDLATRAPFLFSRADAAESPAHDFRLRDVCAATCAGGAAGGAAVEVMSVDGGTRIRAVGGGVALGNPTAAAITHVLNNRREFPAAATIDDLLVMSIGTGEPERRAGGGSRTKAPEVARIAAEGVSDMVDQAVAMAFGHSRTSNYIRIQGTGSRRVGGGGGGRAPRACGGETKQQAVWKAEAMLLQKGVESVLFQGRKLAGETNAEKLERFARELAKENSRRKQQQQQQLGNGQASPSDVPPPVVISSVAAKPTPTPTPPHKATITPSSASASIAGSSTEATALPEAPPPATTTAKRAPAAAAARPDDDDRLVGQKR
ncbi:Patatin-like protein 3 [Dichanthelium oligosanthes]|uniref:Patatin n=1 Tax=Dichanthelium oligosanthes TaxID=888268 RepID=A0A1E5WMD8_9POAL|nr:Patatin-like protein 3 [Dichanthelium oligosanthes]